MAAWIWEVVWIWGGGGQGFEDPEAPGFEDPEAFDFEGVGA